MKLLKLFTFISLFCALLCQVSFAYNLPNLSEPEQANLTSYQEKALGKLFIRYIRQSMPIMHDAIVNDYIHNLGFQLVAHCPNSSQHFYFFVVRDSQINAFAGPDGYIGVNSGLILKTANESELASVIAHEISHVTQKHILRNIAQQKRLMLPNIAAILAAAIVGMKSPDAAAGILATTTAGSYQHILNFSRSFEKEADRIGIQTLAKSGFNPESMAGFFGRLARESQLNGDNIPPLLRTHPVTESRLADAENRAVQYPKKRHYKNSREFPLIQARVLADLYHNKPKTLIRRLEPQLKQHKKDVKLRYAYALTTLKARQLKTASKTIQSLMRQYPSQIYFQITYTNILAAGGKIKQAQANFKKLYRYHPDYYPLIMRYGEFLLHHHQAKQAEKILAKHENDYAHNADFLSLLSYVQGKANKLVTAYQTRAKVHLLHDRKKAAVQQLQMALQFAKHDPFESQKIKAKIHALQKDIKTKK